MNQSGTTHTAQTPMRESKREAGAAPGPAKLYGLIAEFTEPGAIIAAAKRVRDAGYKWWDCHVPFPVHGLDKAMGVRPTILPIIVFFCGLTGTLAALTLQFFTNSMDWKIWAFVWVSGYPFPVSGKPLFSTPAFIPVTFELTVLLSALGSVLCVLLLNNLPRLYHPLFKNVRFARATDDRFYLVIEARDPKFSRSRTEEFMRSLHPASIEAVEA
jgi:hypothetical protein